MNAESSNSQIHRYFAGLAENTFQSQLGIVDPPLVDYLSDLLTRFVRSDVVHRIRSVSGRPLMTVTEMAAEATQRLGDARRELHFVLGRDPAHAEAQGLMESIYQELALDFEGDGP